MSISLGCDNPDRDVVFLIDSSNSAGDETVDNSVGFVTGVISRLKVDTNQGRTVLGLAQFASLVEVNAANVYYRVSVIIWVWGPDQRKPVTLY